MSGFELRRRKVLISIFKLIYCFRIPSYARILNLVMTCIHFMMHIHATKINIKYFVELVKLNTC